MNFSTQTSGSYFITIICQVYGGCAVNDVTGKRVACLYKVYKSNDFMGSWLEYVIKFHLNNMKIVTLDSNVN